MQFTVTAYRNSGPDTHTGYRPGHQLEHAGRYTIKGDSVQHAAAGLIAVGQRRGSDLNGRTWPADGPELSAGDVLRVDTPPSYLAPDGASTWLAAGRNGFTEITEPACTAASGA